MRLVAVLFVALSPVIAGSQTDEWVRDDMTDDSLLLLQTGNLSREPSTAGIFPGAPDRGSQWVVSKGDGPAYVVYFLPGQIHEVEIDTHRQAGAAGDFTLAVSTDGKLYQPINAGSVLLDSSFGWDYRLMASDQIPENATHLLVRFPDGSTAHRLSEVWIRYTWDDALVSRFLPAPVVTTPAQNEFSLQSDADLQLLLDQLMATPHRDPAPSIDPLDTFDHSEMPGTPEPAASVAAAPSFEFAPPLAQPETDTTVEDEEEENDETTEPTFVVDDSAPPQTSEEEVAPGASTVAEESTPTIVADVSVAESGPSAENPDALAEVAINDPAAAITAVVTDETEVSQDVPVVAGNADEPEEPIEFAASLTDASDNEVVSSESGTAEIDVSEFSSGGESDAGLFTVAPAVGAGRPIAPTENSFESATTAVVSNATDKLEINVAEFSPEVDAALTLEAAAAKNDASEPIDIESLAMTVPAPEIAATIDTQPSTEIPSTVAPVGIHQPEAVLVPEPDPVPSPEPDSEEIPTVAAGFTEIEVAEFSEDVDTVPTLEAAAATYDASNAIAVEPLAITEPKPEITSTGETPPLMESAPDVETIGPGATEIVANPEADPASPSVSVSDERSSAANEVTEISVAEFEAPNASATEMVEPTIATITAGPTFETNESLSALAIADSPELQDVAEMEQTIVPDAPVFAEVERSPSIVAPEPEVAIVEPPEEKPSRVEIIDPGAFANPEVEIDAVPPAVIADSPATDAAPEEPEQVWRLPPFNLPVLSTSRPRYDAASIEEPVPTPLEASVAQGFPPTQETQVPAHEIVAASDGVEPAVTLQADYSAANPDIADPESEPATSSASGPILIAAADVHVVDTPEAIDAEESAPDRKPVLKVRRIGPRSKSRDFYSARH